MASARNGKIQLVENKERKFGAAEEYFAVWVENTKGKEYPLLFTDRELRVAIDRAEKNPEDIPVKGFFTDLFD
jgi:hypothetical protein|tara:strand:- start:432 stop:650 length:219 start_codon:yes stop_codon:yes gene_type:complete